MTAIVTSRSFWLTVLGSLLLSEACAVTQKAASDLRAPSISQSLRCDAGMLCILVQSADEPPVDIANAVVWILGRDGQTLADGRTGACGIARLPMPREEDEPTYVLVDADGYFVGGVRWTPGLQEYYVLLNIAVLR
jgi:hypothetical protein